MIASHGTLVVLTIALIQCTLIGCANQESESWESGEPETSSPSRGLGARFHGREIGIAMWKINTESEQSVIVQGVDHADRSVGAFRMTTSDDPAGTLRFQSIDGLDGTVFIARSGLVDSGGNRELSRLAVAFAADVEGAAEHGVSAAEPTDVGVTVQPLSSDACGVGYGPCTTRASVSCAAGLPHGWPTLCITNAWWFSYPYANGCTGETGTGFCFW